VVFILVRLDYRGGRLYTVLARNLFHAARRSCRWSAAVMYAAELVFGKAVLIYIADCHSIILADEDAA
jgi:hypothetical protein